MSPPPHDHAHLAIDPGFAPLLRAHGLDSLDALMVVAAGDDLNKPGLASWRQRIRIELEGQRMFIKRYRRPPLREQLTARLHGFPAVAAIEWHWLRHLREQGIPAAPPVAFGYERRVGIERHSVLMTAGVPGRSLEQWVRFHQTDAAAVPWLNDRLYREALAEAVAGLVRRLHEAGLFHRDLYLAHIFFDPPTEPIEDHTSNFASRLALIDLQRVIRPRLRRRRWQVKDLAALNYSAPRELVSNVQRLRWFKRYRQVRRLSPTDKTLIRRIIAKTRRIAGHDRRRKAALAVTD